MTLTKANLMTVREAAKECGRNEETIRRWIWSGKLPAEKLGNQLFIKTTDLAIYAGKDNPERKLSTDELFEKVAELRKQVNARVGQFDAAALIRESRERRYE